MHRERRIVLLGLLVSLIILTTGSASARSMSQLLYVTTTADLRITGTHDHMRISVPAAAPLSWFTDRPARRAGTATAASLVAGWSANGFNRVPPNAALVTRHGGTSMQTIVTLTQPLRRRGRVSFAYRVVAGTQMLGMRTTGRPQLGRYRGELFVDDAALPPCPAIGFGFAEVDAGASQSCVVPQGTAFSVDLTRVGTSEIRVCGADGHGSLGIPSSDWRDPVGTTSYADIPACPLDADSAPQAVLIVHPTCPWEFCRLTPASAAYVAGTDLVVTTSYAPLAATDPTSIPAGG